MKTTITIELETDDNATGHVWNDEDWADENGDPKPDAVDTTQEFSTNLHTRLQDIEGIGLQDIIEQALFEDNDFAPEGWEQLADLPEGLGVKLTVKVKPTLAQKVADDEEAK